MHCVTIWKSSQKWDGWDGWMGENKNNNNKERMRRKWMTRCDEQNFKKKGEKKIVF